MKKLLSKLVCLILSVSVVASLFTVFAFGEDEDETDNSEMRVLFNRTFDEGWGLNNGLTSYGPKENNFFIDNEETETFDRNYFVRFEALNGKDGYIDLGFSAAGYPEKDHTVIEFDFKVDDFLDLKEGNSGAPTIAYMRTKGGSKSGKKNDLLAVQDGYMKLFNDSAYSYEMKNGWVHIVIDLDYTDEELLDSNKFVTTITVTDLSGEELICQSSKTLSGGGQGVGLDILRLGFPATSTPDARLGMSWCMDNLKMYCFVSGPTDIDFDTYRYGELIDEKQAPTVDIEGSGNGSNSEKVNNSLAMKIGVENVLFKQVKRKIYEGGGYGAPQKVDGVVYIPLEILLEYLGYPKYVHEDGMSYDITSGDSSTYITIGRDSAMVDGELVNLTAAPCYLTGSNGKKYPVIAMNDVEALFSGQYVTYDDMGLIVICQIDDIYNRDDDLKSMMNVMKAFIYDLPTDTEIYEDVRSYTNFDHPYLLTTQDQLDRLSAIYFSEEGDENYDPTVKTALVDYVKGAEEVYRTFALPAGNKDYSVFSSLDYTNTDLYQPYLDTSNGYDPSGGRLGVVDYRGGEIQQLAFAYQITRDEKYARCAFDFLIAMGEWVHWGPGHYLDCADGGGYMAIAYDLLYDKFEELEGQEPDRYKDANLRIAKIFQKHVMLTAMDTINKVCRFDRKQGNVYYNTMTNNWNAVCTAGVANVALAIMEYNYEEGFDNYPAFIISDNLKTLTDNGMGQYAPDGSYIESPSYWAYGTNNFYRLVALLRSSTGKNYTLMNCWGLDRTVYFALQIESSDYRCFNYHDANMGQMDHSYFFFVGKEMNDPGLVAIRMKQLKYGKSFTIVDLFFYPFDEDISADESPELALDYYMEGIDAAVSRSSWEKGAMYVGIIGGNNGVSHGQIDSGDFVYHNDGKCWIQDLGHDNYNVFGYFGGGSTNARYRYYKMNAEGNNTLALTSDPTSTWGGQTAKNGGTLSPEDWLSNEHGSYARIDQANAYEGKVVYAWRGMLVTNDRNTVIIQDEVSTEKVQSFLWNAHFDCNKYGVTLSKDRRTAYLSDGSGKDLRLSIVSDTKAFYFTIMDTYEFFLTGEYGTVDKDWSVKNGGERENSRNGFNKLAVVAKDVLSFNLAVVIELIDPNNEIDVGYKWTNMKDWMPYADTRDSGSSGSDTVMRETPKLSDIRSSATKAQKYVDEGTAYTTYFSGFYRALTDIEYAVDYLDSIPSNYDQYLELYQQYKSVYSGFVDSVKSKVDLTKSLIEVFTGMSAKQTEE